MKGVHALQSIVIDINLGKVICTTLLSIYEVCLERQ